MTSDVVVLLRGEPTKQALVRAMVAAGPDLRVGSIGGGAALQLFDADRALIATLELPLHVQVAGEAERLLGIADAPQPPYWWVELRCPTLQSDAVAVALQLAQSLIDELGGVTWRSPDLA